MNARHARIGPRCGVDAGIDRLEILQLSTDAPGIVVIQQIGAAFEVGDAGLVGADREVLEITAVADAGDVGVEAQSVLDVGDVGDADIAAIVVFDFIVRQKGCID